MCFVGTRSERRSTKMPKHVHARFRDVVFQNSQYWYFFRCILWAITSKASTIYVIADENLS